MGPRKKALATLLALLMLCATVRLGFSIMHADVKVVCPVCHTQNVFTAIVSWGSYIYQWPSKFQLLFFPHTDPTQLYHCKRCHFTAWSWDFEALPVEKSGPVAKMLEGVTCRTHADDYKQIPTSERLEMAEHFYRQLDKDEDFWCQFYRVKGYHLQGEGKQVEAAAVRQEALRIALNLAARKDKSGQRKELLVIAAAMHHYLGADAQALGELDEAATLTFAAPGLAVEQNQNANQYLSQLIDEYIAALKQGRSTDEPGQSPDNPE